MNKKKVKDLPSKSNKKNKKFYDKVCQDFQQ